MKEEWERAVRASFRNFMSKKFRTEDEILDFWVNIIKKSIEFTK